VAAVSLAALLAVTDLAIGSVREFWLEHAMVTALAGFAVTLCLTLLVIDEVVSRRQSDRWSIVGRSAIRKLSGSAFFACASWIETVGFEGQGDRMIEAVRAADNGCRPGFEADPLLPDGFEAAFADILDDSSRREALAEVTRLLTEAMEEALARWAPVLVEAPDLAEALNLFGVVYSSLGDVAGAIDQLEETADARRTVWTCVRVFLFAFSCFDAIRREILGETPLFGHTAEEHETTWGMPFKIPPRSQEVVTAEA